MIRRKNDHLHSRSENHGAACWMLSLVALALTLGSLIVAAVS